MTQPLMRLFWLHDDSQQLCDAAVGEAIKGYHGPDVYEAGQITQLVETEDGAYVHSTARAKPFLIDPIE
jgi:hypothetical protein